MFIKSLEFFDYKSYPHFSISAKKRNVLVGPNNIGKSTALDALRIAFDALRFATRRNAILKSQGSDGVCATYFVPPTVIQTDLRYCVHNFGNGNAAIHLRSDDGSIFKMNIPVDGDLECYLVTDAKPQKTTTFLGKSFPLKIRVVPTLSPLEQNEELVKEETVDRNRYGRLASRNFRNFWLHRSDEEFEEFADLVEIGWPGLRIRKPETQRSDGKVYVRMYFRDGPNVREVQWAGFGFQVWMQTMMHLLGTNQNSILVLDEPDIYLHPDLQHRLLRIISQRVGQYFIATHSTEIINDVDAGDVLVLRPGARSAKRIRTEDDYAAVYDAIGSSENSQFARLARTKKVLYFEGHDNKILAKLAKLSGGSDYLGDASVTIMKTEGFSNWAKVSTSAWVLNKFFEFNVKVAALFDRDYRCDADVADFEAQINGNDVLCYVLPVREIENILLVPRVIAKVVARYSRSDLSTSFTNDFLGIFYEVIDSFRDQALSGRIAKRIEYELMKNPKRDVSTVSTEEMQKFSVGWKSEDFRIAVVPGKAALSMISKAVQDQYGVSLTPSRIIDEMQISDLNPAIPQILLGFRDHFKD
jgi:hypothetical protein